mmetsp:Transcript_7993/g.23838  ORF Transcript_7993/g.23838 Transcript_7993/m.23838 type:complete len:345 (+) Transcript_7993:507-1541(+)
MTTAGGASTTASVRMSDAGQRAGSPSARCTESSSAAVPSEDFSWSSLTAQATPLREADRTAPDAPFPRATAPAKSMSAKLTAGTPPAGGFPTRGLPASASHARRGALSTASGKPSSWLLANLRSSRDRRFATGSAPPVKLWSRLLASMSLRTLANFAYAASSMAAMALSVKMTCTRFGGSAAPRMASRPLDRRPRRVSAGRRARTAGTCVMRRLPSTKRISSLVNFASARGRSTKSFRPRSSFTRDVHAPMASGSAVRPQPARESSRSDERRLRVLVSNCPGWAREIHAIRLDARRGASRNARRGASILGLLCRVPTGPTRDSSARRTAARRRRRRRAPASGAP